MSLVIGEEQALWFRARRHFLAREGGSDAGAGDGSDARTVVAAVLGIQAQQEGPALLGLSQRMRHRPSAGELLNNLRAEGLRDLVWTWGQRDTLHFVDAREDWQHLVAARSQWAGGGRRGGMPSQAVLDHSWRALATKSGVMTKDALEGVLPEAYIQEVAPFAETARMEPKRFAATRVMWKLAQRGDLSLAGKQGHERIYARRQEWFPQVPWKHDVDSVASAALLAKRYLAAYAPATRADIASFFGARVKEVRTWLACFEEDLIEVNCGKRRGLLALGADEAVLGEKPPAGKDWPVRLLPLWDGLLMGHKDKSWLLPDATENKKVWRPGAYVAATVHARGRIVATWSHKIKRSQLQITLKPLNLWRKAYMKEVTTEAKAIANHWDLAEVQVQIG